MTEKQVVIITGASKGIGRVTAELYRDRGYTVYGFSRGGLDISGVNSVKCDVTDSQKLSAAIDGVFEAEGRIDILVNNAGMGISGAAEKTTENDAKRLFELNFFALTEAVKFTVPYMRKSGGGKIINIGSVAGTLHIPFQTYYSASKAAVEAYSNCMRGELKPFNIKMCTMLPGDTHTNFTDAREKNFNENDPDYGTRINKSITMMEKDERGGMSPESVAKVIFKASKKKNPKPLYTVGFKYKLFVFLSKILPKKWITGVINSMYAK